MISVVVPTFNEVKSNSTLFAYLENLRKYCPVEVIAIDSQSQDGTWEKIPSNCQKFSIQGKTRAERLNEGIKKAKYPLVLLHHPRSRVDKEGILELDKKANDKVWGGFTHSFDHKHPILDFTSWYSNNLRLKYRKIVYLDHCLFFHKNLLSKNYSIDPVDIFEDTLISLELKKSGLPLKIPYKSTTSSERFLKNGIVKQCLLNAGMKLGFYLKISPEKMNRIYEKGLFLNTEYKKEIEPQKKE
jgi:glycosyltransferase involved in cell wall biosynthesis